MHKEANTTYNFSVVIGDLSNTQIVSFLGEHGEPVMGMTANDLKNMKS
jgi:hypothetical protein